MKIKFILITNNKGKNNRKIKKCRMDTHILKKGYEIVQHSICEGWINNLYDGDGNPYVFSTLEEAIAELQEEFNDWQFEIENGYRDEDDGYDVSDFQILCKVTDMVYALDLIEGQVVIVYTYSHH